MTLSRFRPPRGFTLIELLVTVTIITLLLAILLPSVSRSMLAARIAACASNYHQWGVSVTTYAVGSQNALPRFDMPGTGRNMPNV